MGWWTQPSQKQRRLQRSPPQQKRRAWKWCSQCGSWEYADQAGHTCSCGAAWTPPGGPQSPKDKDKAAPAGRQEQFQHALSLLQGLVSPDALAALAERGLAEEAPATDLPLHERRKRAAQRVRQASGNVTQALQKEQALQTQVANLTEKLAKAKADLTAATEAHQAALGEQRAAKEEHDKIETEVLLAPPPTATTAATAGLQQDGDGDATMDPADAPDPQELAQQMEDKFGIERAKCTQFAEEWCTVVGKKGRKRPPSPTTAAASNAKEAVQRAEEQTEAALKHARSANPRPMSG